MHQTYQSPVLGVRGWNGAQAGLIVIIPASCSSWGVGANIFSFDLPNNHMRQDVDVCQERGVLDQVPGMFRRVGNQDGRFFVDRDLERAPMVPATIRAWMVSDVFNVQLLGLMDINNQNFPIGIHPKHSIP